MELEAPLGGLQCSRDALRALVGSLQDAAAVWVDGSTVHGILDRRVIVGRCRVVLLDEQFLRLVAGGVALRVVEGALWPFLVVLLVY
jgi:hypothetical protein